MTVLECPEILNTIGNRREEKQGRLQMKSTLQKIQDQKQRSVAQQFQFDVQTKFGISCFSHDGK